MTLDLTWFLGHNTKVQATMKSREQDNIKA